MEEIKVSGAKLVEQLKALIKEGNVRRVVLRNPQGRVLMDVPLNAGVAASVLLPFWAAVASVAEHPSARADRARPRDGPHEVGSGARWRNAAV